MVQKILQQKTSGKRKEGFDVCEDNGKQDGKNDLVTRSARRI